MIAMLLMAQLGAEIARGPAVQFVQPLTPDAVQTYRVVPDAPGGLVRIVPMGPCPGAGRLEVSQAVPTALYRQGDRPPHLYLERYPLPKLCLVGGAP